MAVLLDGHTWLWVNTYTPQFDVSWSHGGKGSPFDVHCRQYSSEMCWVALLDRFTLAARQIHVGEWSNALQLELYTTVNGGMGSPFGFCCRRCTVMVFAGSSNSSL